jgi:hypothetical protein
MRSKRIILLNVTLLRPLVSEYDIFITAANDNSNASDHCNKANHCSKLGVPQVSFQSLLWKFLIKFTLTDKIVDHISFEYAIRD